MVQSTTCKLTSTCGDGDSGDRVFACNDRPEVRILINTAEIKQKYFSVVPNWKCRQYIIKAIHIFILYFIKAQLLELLNRGSDKN